MSWFKKLLPSRIRTETSQRKGVPEGLWVKCLGCSEVLYSTELAKNLMVCPSCHFHHRVSARTRIAQFLDESGQEEIAGHLEPQDRLKFRDSKKYKDRIVASQEKSGYNDAISCAAVSIAVLFSSLIPTLIRASAVVSLTPTSMSFFLRVSTSGWFATELPVPPTVPTT